MIGWKAVGIVIWRPSLFTALLQCDLGHLLYHAGPQFPHLRKKKKKVAERSDLPGPFYLILYSSMNRFLL